MFKLCRDPFNSSLYTSVRGHLYLFANGPPINPSLELSTQALPVRVERRSSVA